MFVYFLIGFYNESVYNKSEIEFFCLKPTKREMSCYNVESYRELKRIYIKSYAIDINNFS